MSFVPKLTSRYFSLDSVNATNGRLSPFLNSLMELEPRIRFHSIGDELYDKKFFFITKDHIHIPCTLPDVSHEVAHAVGMKDSKRWIMPDWGLGTIGFEKKAQNKPAMFFAAFVRETKVRAIQSHMGLASFSSMVDHPFWGDEATKHFPYKRFKTIQDLRVWHDDLFEKTKKQYCLDRIREEWKIRLHRMQNYMETATEHSPSPIAN